jgi:hypothetical protein
MKRFGIFAIMGVIVVGAAYHSVWAETVTVQAKDKDNPQQNASDIEGHFTQAPTSYADEIDVTNQDMTASGAGVYNDPVNDGAILAIIQLSNPAKVSVEGREGLGAIYWVTMGGGTASGPGNLWADVQDVKTIGALTLTDPRTSATKSDSTDTTSDTPTLYCAAPIPALSVASVNFTLDTQSGEYNWQITDSNSTLIGFGTLTSPSYMGALSGLQPGSYTLAVTCSSKPAFNRTINCCVVETGQDVLNTGLYPVSGYPQDPVNTIQASDTNTFSFSDQGQLVSITVSAPLDGELTDPDENTEGETNPYGYNNNYSIAIDPNSGTATVTLGYAGVYMLKTVRTVGGVAQPAVYQLLEYSDDGTFAGEWGGAKLPIVIIVTPHWDYNLVYQFNIPLFVDAFNSITVHPRDYFTAWNAAATSVQVLAIAELGVLKKKYDLAIVASGNKPIFGGATLAGGVSITSTNVANVLGTPIANTVNRIRFYACHSGDLPDGPAFLTALKQSANATSASGYIDEVGVLPWPYLWIAGNWGTKQVE